MTTSVIRQRYAFGSSPRLDEPPRPRLGGQHDMPALFLHPALPGKRIDCILAIAARDNEMRPGTARRTEYAFKQLGGEPSAIVLLTQCDPQGFYGTFVDAMIQEDSDS